MAPPLKLSRRLEVIAENIPSHATFADIGSDHAYLPCRVCFENPTIQAIAGEVQQGPYENAKKNVKIFGLTENVSVRLGNGLEVIKTGENIDMVVIAGMGGQLIIDILKQAPAKWQGAETIILQPNTDIPMVRRYIYEAGFQLFAEFIVADSGIIYEILIAKKHAPNPYSENDKIRDKEFTFGPFLMREKHPVFMDKWKWEYKNIQYILSQLKYAKKQKSLKTFELTTRMAWIKEDIL